MLQGSSVTDTGANDGGPQFAEVFVVYWLGATVVTLNIKLLGGSMYVYSVFELGCLHCSRFCVLMLMLWNWTLA